MTHAKRDIKNRSISIGEVRSESLPYRHVSSHPPPPHASAPLHALSADGVF